MIYKRKDRERKIYEGYMKNKKYHGFGHLNQDKVKYSGSFFEGKKSGLGRLSDKN